jgi:hypothetical protein
MSEGIQQRRDFVIPVYLNQRIVFDMVAVLQGGLTTITRISEAEQRSSNDQRRYGASFGLSQAFEALFKIGISGTRERSDAEAGLTQKSAERVHTPASLFHELRSVLTASGALTRVDSTYSPAAGDMVEFTSSLRRNPVVHVMDYMLSFMEVALAFEETPPAAKRNKFRPQESEARKTKSQFETMVQMLRAGHTVDLVADELANRYKAIVTLEEEFLNDPTMADLVDGQFRVLGKVSKVISGPDEFLNLLRKHQWGRWVIRCWPPYSRPSHRSAWPTTSTSHRYSGRFLDRLCRLFQ